MRLILALAALVCVAAVASAGELYTAPGGCVYEKQDSKWVLVWCPNREGAKGIPSPTATPAGPAPVLLAESGPLVLTSKPLTVTLNPVSPPTTCGPAPVATFPIPQQMAGPSCGQPAAILQGPQWHPLQRFRGFFRPHCRGL